jgi:hypothetical protein
MADSRITDMERNHQSSLTGGERTVDLFGSRKEEKAPQILLGGSSNHKKVKESELVVEPELLQQVVALLCGQLRDCDGHMVQKNLP